MSARALGAVPMTVPTEVPDSKPAPDARPGLVPELPPEAVLLGHEVDDAFEEIRIKVSFGGPKLYTYLSPPFVHVGSLVVVPPSWFCSEPQIVDVARVNTPPVKFPLKRVLAVLS